MVQQWVHFQPELCVCVCVYMCVLGENSPTKGFSSVPWQVVSNWNDLPCLCCLSFGHCLLGQER